MWACVRASESGCECMGVLFMSVCVCNTDSGEFRLPSSSTLFVSAGVVPHGRLQCCGEPRLPPLLRMQAQGSPGGTVERCHCVNGGTHATDALAGCLNVVTSLVHHPTPNATVCSIAWRPPIIHKFNHLSTRPSIYPSIQLSVYPYPPGPQLWGPCLPGGGCGQGGAGHAGC